MKKYVFMFLLSLTSMVSMARDSIVTARQRCQIEARDKAELLVPITPTYLDCITSTTGWDNNWFVEAKGGTSAFIGTPIGCGDCLLYTSPSPRDRTRSRMPSSA